MQHDELTTPLASSNPVSEPPLAKKRTLSFTPYVAVWSGLAMVAVAYIAVAIASPDWIGTHSSPTTEKFNDNLQATSKSAQSDSLEAKLARLENDLASDLADNPRRAAEKKSHLERIAALEAKAAKAEAHSSSKSDDTSARTATSLPANTVSLPPARGSSKQAADEIAERLAGAKILNTAEAEKNTTTLVKQSTKAAADKQAANITESAGEDLATTNAKSVADQKAVSPANAPAAKPVVKNKIAADTDAAKPALKSAPKKVAAVAKPKPKPKPKSKTPAKIKTGSIGKAATKPISFGPAVVTRTTRPIGVRVATGPSIDSLRLSWIALADRHGDTLNNLQPRYVTGIDATGLTYDLIAGPFNTANEASQVCARLHASGARCALGEYNGNAL